MGNQGAEADRLNVSGEIDLSDRIERIVRAEISAKHSALSKLQTGLWTKLVLSTLATLLMIVGLLLWVSHNPIISPSQRNALQIMESRAEDLIEVLDSDLAALEADGAPASDSLSSVPGSAGQGQVASALAESPSKQAELVRMTRDLSAAMVDLTASPTPMQLALGQVVPLGALVLILGLLGLRRMQGYDSEIAVSRTEITASLEATRQTLFDELRDQRRVSVEQADQLRRDIDADSVALREDVQKRIADGINSEFLRNKEGIDQLNNALEVSKAEIAEAIQNGTDQMQNLVDANPWLGSAELKDLSDAINSVSSVAQAKSLAETYLLQSPPEIVAAEQALRQISERNLVGDADDFHNAFTVASARPVDNVELAQQILSRGRQLFPQNADLVADLVANCGASGRELPRDEIERLREGGSYWVFWRVAAYEADMLANQGDEQGLRAAIDLMEDAVVRRPYEPQFWRRLASYYARIGEMENCIGSLERAVEHCPGSQIIRAVYAEHLLTVGRVEQAAKQADAAMRADVHATYQHSISQTAVMLTAGQAYEASGQTERAVQIYQRILVGIVSRVLQPETSNMLEYPRHRLVMLGRSDLIPIQLRQNVGIGDMPGGAVQGNAGDGLLERATQLAEAFVEDPSRLPPKEQSLGIMLELKQVGVSQDHLVALRRVISERYELTRDDHEFLDGLLDSD